MVNVIEKRPKLQRRCPFHAQSGCDWIQVTEWFVGGPDATMKVPRQILEEEAAAHFLHAHPGRTPLIIPLS